MKYITLPLKFRQENIRNLLCISVFDDIILSQAAMILSPNEMKRYNSFKIDVPRTKYLLGRYSAKQAYLKLSGEISSMSKIEIKNGIFANPILNDPEFDISISHTYGMGAGIVFDRSFPIGIDLEKIDLSKVAALRLMTSKVEIENINTISELDILTVAWCFKEALSKVIKTGLTIPLELLKIEKFMIKTDIFRCIFSNFTQYSGYAKKITNNIVIAVVYPNQLNLNDW